MLMACGQFGQPREGTHVLAILDGDALLVATAAVLVLIIVITSLRGLLALVFLVVSVLLRVILVSTSCQGRRRAVGSAGIAADTPGPAGDLSCVVACSARRTSARN